MTSEAFAAALGPLGAHAPGHWTDVCADDGLVEVALVINTPRLPVRLTLPLVERHGQGAVERLYPKQPEDFRSVPNLPIPTGEAYLLMGVDRGNETSNAVPTDAARALTRAGRSPLTIEEGVALLLQWPEFLQPNRCFMMLGSRCGDRRVPAMWLSNKQPKLGWCWEGNPHAWLDSHLASQGPRCAAASANRPNWDGLNAWNSWTRSASFEAGCPLNLAMTPAEDDAKRAAGVVTSLVDKLRHCA